MLKPMSERAKEIPRKQAELERAGDEARLKELILYISDQCADEPTFGATMLNKILFGADFISYARYGEAITGVPYQRLPKGPAPLRLVPVRKEMEAANEIAIQKRLYHQFTQHRIVPLREANLDKFKARDIALVDEAIKGLCRSTAAQVSEWSHGIEWKIASDNDLIPYETSLLQEPEVTANDIVEAFVLAAKHGWTDV